MKKNTTANDTGSTTTQTVTCTVCGEEKSQEAFYKDKRRPAGLKSECKECSKAQHSDWRSRNPGKDNEDAKKRRAKDPRKDREKNRRHYEKNKMTERARSKKWNEDNREIYLKVAREYGRKRRSTTKGKLESNVSRAIRRSLMSGKKAGRSTFEMLGYTVDDLRRHLEKQFLPGMSWDNYGKWHIDHIVPLSAHNYETPDDIDFKRAWALENLRPLWAKDNLEKGRRLLSAFQPSLPLSDIRP